MINLLPFKQGDDSRCGPSSIKSVLYYYGIDATENEICKRCNWSYEVGCTDDGIKKAIESYGLGCSIINNCNLEDIEYWIKHHIPVIVDWFTPGINPGLEDMPDGHSGVIVGIDRNRVYMLDPEIGAIRSIMRHDFLRVWFDWRSTSAIENWQNMVLRQIIIAYPKALTYSSSQP